MLFVFPSVGMGISEIDLQNLQMFCKRVLSLYEVKQTNIEHLKTKMRTTAPNMSTLVGEMVSVEIFREIY